MRSIPFDKNMVSASSQERKPDIISFCNLTKGGVDAVNKQDNNQCHLK